MDDHDDLINHFVAVTSCAEEFARSFLEAAGWNLNEALNMYLGGGGAAATSLATPVGPPARQALNNNAQQERTAARRDRVREIMEEQGVDELTARAIAEVENENKSEDIRAPIAATRTRLIDTEDQFGSRHLSGMNVFRDFDAEARMMEARIIREAGGLSSTVHQNIQTADFVQEPFQREANLQNLFSPPRDILFQGSWEEARELAKQRNKWILVNIQKDSEFLSYNLNRDLWSNEIIKELIQDSFIFFQHEESDSDAAKYKTYYRPDVYPHVAIVDPFTGEQMIVIDLSRHQNDPTDLMMDFLERTNLFLQNNRLEGDKIKIMQQKMMQNFQRKQNSAVANTKKQRTVEDSRNKTNTSSTTATRSESNRFAFKVDEDDSDEDEVLVEETNSKRELEDEPPEDEDTTVIQIRLFGGKTVKRRFRNSQLVEDIFEYVMREYPEARKKPFDIKCFPQKSLLTEKMSTISEQKLQNTSLRAVFM